MFPFDYNPNQDYPDYTTAFNPDMSFDMSGVSGGGSNDNGPGGNVYSPTGDNFLDLVGQARNSPALTRPDIPIYDPNDPSLQKYKALAASAPQSESIIESYLHSMPNREDYNPSTGKKIAAFLLDTIGNIKTPQNAGRAMEDFLNTPYTNALADWKNQGTSVQNQARLADAARNRELQSLSFDVKQKESGNKFKSLGDQFDINKAIQAAGGQTREQAQQAIQDRFNERQADQNEFRSRELDLKQQAQDLREQLGELRGTGGSKKLLDPTELKVRQQAALMGIPEKDSAGHAATIGDLANEIAMMELHQNPVMKDYFKPQEDGTFTIDAGNPTLTEFIQSQVDTLRKQRIKELLGIGGQ